MYRFRTFHCHSLPRSCLHPSGHAAFRRTDGFFVFPAQQLFFTSECLKTRLKPVEDAPSQDKKRGKMKL